MNLIKNNLTESNEYKLILRLVILNQNIEIDEFEMIDYENLIKIASSNLMIPSLYKSLLKTKKIKQTPADFSNYIKYIYEINKRRNEELKKELKFIESILQEQNIKFLFFKGSALIIDEIYEDIGERMIGDIDVFVKDDINMCKKILNKHDYSNSYNYRFWKRKHIPKMINKNKLFSIEPHIEFLNISYRSLFSSEIAFSKYFSDKYEFHMIICILNAQINDYGSLYAHINLRAAKDFIEINKHIKINYLDFLKSSHFRKFILMLNELGLYKLNFRLKLSEKIFLLRFNFKRRYKLYFLIDNFICDLIRSSPKKIMKFIEYVFNKDYRFYINQNIKP